MSELILLLKELLSRLNKLEKDVGFLNEALRNIEHELATQKKES